MSENEKHLNHPAVVGTEEHHDVDHKHEVAVVKTVQGDESFQQAMLKEPPRAWNGTSILLYAYCAVAFCCSTTNGYDGSLFGTLLSNKNFKAFFGVENAGIEAGIVTAMYQIGSVAVIPFMGPALDTWGRRGGMFIAALIIVIGVIIQATCIINSSVQQFMAGRFLLGFGVGIIGAAGPTYVVEVSHPAHRGVATGLYNVFWPVGALVASGAARGGLDYGGNTSWMIPVCLQLMFPTIILFFVWFLPESPRWQYTRGQREKATGFLTKFHGHGNSNSEWVKLQLAEYEEHLELDGSDKRWWDYRALFRDRASVYRLVLASTIMTFGQWAGNGVVSYFLSAFLDTAGIKGDVTQTNVAVGMNAIQIFFAGLGACFVDKFGRRTMLFWVNVACSLCWIGVVIPTSIANVTDPSDEAQIDAVDPNVSRAVLAMVYIFQITYSFGWTPMQALYPVEVLSFELRAKGMALASLFMNAALLTTQFGMPVSLKNIAWRTYIVFVVWCAVQAAVIWVFVPETKNRTLEELDDIFNSPNPAKASIAKKVLEVDSSANIVHVSAVERTGHGLGHRRGGSNA